ncbi:actin filament-associated protein 1-like 2 isoform X2 [Dicentrarchus labrax]|uniref:actin filament-associated protein 1-like 2 isoform X2 n=1 Tax=Dicentrarchus labrax TaxID=13489 RepID=UPI0021F65D94|nr:actin filament-associated protein 1-like 2 isoform X2 [Dicentrarchus labrax]
MFGTLRRRHETEDQLLTSQTDRQTDMDKQKVLAKLIWDLQSFLSVLDSENLSYIAQAQKKSISELLSKLQTNDTPVEDAEYMIMSCPSLSPSNEQIDSPGTEGVRSSELVLKRDSLVWLRNGGPIVPPPLPPGGLGGDDEDTYEEAEPYVADTTTSNTEKAESDSSHYESYGDEDDDDDEPVKDRAHYIQWSASQPCLRPVPESRLCGYLWRRKWLGQWTKQLFIIRNDVLLCYKCAQDLLPQLELSLRGCQLVYKSKCNRKIQHQLKLVPLGSETLVLGYGSFQQADEWKKVIEEVSVGGEMETQSSLSLIRSDQLLSCRSSTVQTDSEEEKPSAPCSFNKDKGFLSVLMNCQWQSLLCQVEAGLLNMFGEEEHEEEEEEEEEGGEVKRERSPQYTVQLRGCEVRAGPDTDHSYRITLSTLGDQVAVLEVSSSDEKERWLKLLQDGANHSHHGNNTQEHTGGALSGLQIRKFPTSNTYMDDPFHLNVTGRDQPIYSNTSILEHMFQGSQDSVHCSSVSSRDSMTYSNTIFTTHNRKSVEVERGVQKLELTGKRTVQLRAGSETNLASAGKQNKRTFRQSLAVCTERAQAGFLNPLLRRTASAKNTLRRAPSALFIEHGKVFQKRKEWETKAAA